MILLANSSQPRIRQSKTWPTAGQNLGGVCVDKPSVSSQRPSLALTGRNRIRYRSQPKGLRRSGNLYWAKKCSVSESGMCSSWVSSIPNRRLRSTLVSGWQPMVTIKKMPFEKSIARSRRSGLAYSGERLSVGPTLSTVSWNIGGDGACGRVTSRPATRPQRAKSHLGESRRRRHPERRNLKPVGSAVRACRRPSLWRHPHPSLRSLFLRRGGT